MFSLFILFILFILFSKLPPNAKAKKHKLFFLRLPQNTEKKKNIFCIFFIFRKPHTENKETKSLFL